MASRCDTMIQWPAATGSQPPTTGKWCIYIAPLSKAFYRDCAPHSPIDTYTFIHYIAGGGNQGFRVLLKHSSTPTQGESGIKLSVFKDSHSTPEPMPPHTANCPWYWPSTAAGPRPSSVAGYQPPASDYQLLVTGPWPPVTFHQPRSRPQVPQSGRGLPLSWLSSQLSTN